MTFAKAIFSPTRAAQRLRDSIGQNLPPLVFPHPCSLCHRIPAAPSNPRLRAVVPGLDAGHTDANEALRGLSS
jgi:hypothetical protein